MESSLRYGGDSKSLRIHAKEMYPIATDSNTLLQLHGELDTRLGAPTYLSAMIRHFYPDRESQGAAELNWIIFNFKKDQDLRFKVGYEVVDKIPYFQIKENNWTFNADGKGKWNVRYDL
ncbi:outer envelope pore protein 21B, chloroplastic-like isoform X2 [Olea europaea var. sylvestris]|uniref:outer envelope pore protein 21B, chloroplastic-like isoform X2 n=1 Tax=Olea europaea var. sylvestris TaxID=158386 RepID=UPI000C1D76B6|nr:outer envelope pore protein 21B, chloroplastic-like isoform X2 [Olea europaea var. sylvestris]